MTNFDYVDDNLAMAGISKEFVDFSEVPGDYTPKIVFISGPITGMPVGNAHAFSWAKRQYLQKHPHDIVLNPCVFPAGLSYGFYMELTLRMLAECTHIIMLDGWEKSTGANIERAFALKNGIVEINIDGMQHEPTSIK
jgi:hypothetical protein